MTRLHPDDLAVLADLVADRVIARLTTPTTTDASPPALIDAHEAARLLHRTPAWVRRNADQLGAVRLGDGPRPRLAFDPRRIAEHVTACSTTNISERRETAAPPAQPRRHRQRARGTTAGALPFDGPGVPAWR